MIGISSTSLISDKQLETFMKFLESEHVDHNGKPHGITNGEILKQLFNKSTEDQNDTRKTKTN